MTSACLVVRIVQGLVAEVIAAAHVRIDLEVRLKLTKCKHLSRSFRALARTMMVPPSRSASGPPLYGTA